MSFIYSGRVTEDHGSGVGVLLSSAAARGLESYECIADRLLTARVNCGIILMTIVVCYAPTDVAEAEKKISFINPLKRCYRVRTRMICRWSLEISTHVWAI